MDFSKKKLFRFLTIVSCILLVCLVVSACSKNAKIAQNQNATTEEKPIDEMERWFNAEQQVEYRRLSDEIEKNPNNASTLVSLAKLHLAIGDRFGDDDPYAKALASFERALVLDPTNQYLLDHIGWLNLMLFRFNEAEHYFNESIAGQPTKPALTGLGWVAYLEMDYNKSTQLFSAAIEANQDEFLLDRALNPELGLAWSQYRMRSYEKALAIFKDNLGNQHAIIGAIASLMALGKDNDAAVFVQEIKIDTLQTKGTLGSLNREFTACLHDTIEASTIHQCVNSYYDFGFVSMG